MTWLERLRLRVSVGLLVALLAIGAGLWAFAELAEEVGEQGTLVRFDTELANALHQGATPLTTTAFLVISWIGSPGGVLLVVIVALLLLVRRRFTQAAMLTAAYVGAEGLNWLLKTVFMRPRPVFDAPLATAGYYSFPSGHAMVSLVVFGMLAYLLILSVPNRYTQILIVFAAVLLVVLIGISRLYLGVHYFSDVVGGYVAGTVWLIACITAAESLRRRKPVL
ncbi:MAG: phosphatase PAP2 family protein [Chloroflexi bacterium]|nr:phosphatase PAP2 family protein [Chloroflexota bacterium]